jgi:hypothetical protein
MSGGAITLANKDERFAKSMVAHTVLRTIDDEIIARADTVYLSDELHELVDTASESMPDEVLFRTDVYSPCAMVFLERPIYVEVEAGCMADDIDGLVDKVLHYGGTVEGTRKHTKTDSGFIEGKDTYEIIAFSWGDSEVINPHVLSIIEEQFGKDSAEYSEALNHSGHLDEDGTWRPMNALMIGVFGKVVSSEIDGLTMRVKHKLLSNRISLIDNYFFFFGEDGLALENDTNEEVMNEPTYERYRKSRRFLIALLRLMNEYVDIETTRAPRSHSRRGTRLGRVNTESVTTLALRRALYGDGDSGTGRKVSLAHLVRGHWRNQWYPSQQMHRARWINAHRRGGSAIDEVVDKPRIVTVTR